jgi:hypothetical protein
MRIAATDVLTAAKNIFAGKRSVILELRSSMCRNIRPLFNFDPPVTEEEMRAAALQFVRKISGYSKPAQANEMAFARAVDEVTMASKRLLGSLATAAPKKNREVEREKARLAGMKSRSNATIGGV